MTGNFIITYPPISGGPEFDKNAKYFIKAFSDDLKEVAPKIIITPLICGSSMIVFDIFLSTKEKLHIFVTKLGIAINKCVNINSQWKEISHFETKRGEIISINRELLLN